MSIKEMQTSQRKHSKAGSSSNHVRIFNNKPANNPLLIT